MNRKVYKWFLGSAVAVFFAACGGSSSHHNGNTNPPPNQSNPPETNEITHNGISYGIVVSPLTNRVWLDRNLGAARVCTSMYDTACYGDYYQWGRGADGHQDSMSDTTTTEFSDPDNTDDKFVIEHMGWGPSSEDTWAKTDGSSICPIGFRVPNMNEMRAETISASTPITNADDAFSNFLVLPKSGYRDNVDGLIHSDFNGFWINEKKDNFPGSYSLKTTDTSAEIDGELESVGFPVRCIKD